MPLLLDLSAVSALANPERLGAFREAIDPAWIDSALEATGTASLRKRRLPAEQVIWLVLGMGLMRDRPLTDVVGALDLVMPNSGRSNVTSSTISAARDRLGPEPLQWLFERTGAQWASNSSAREHWRGLSLYALDGTSMLVPDTLENRAHFGSASAGKRGDSGYPLVRVVALIAPRSHILHGAAIGSYRDSSEASLSRDLFASVPDNSLTLVDRNFLNAATLVGIWRGGQQRHWMTRTKSTTKVKVLQKLGPGDDLVELEVTDRARKLDPTLPKNFVARAVRYQRPGFQPQTVLTSLIDAARFPRAEVAALYHERWEIELAYGELKTDMLDAEPTLRSKDREGIEQELWGLLLTYNLIRLEMQRVAIRVGVTPVRISFVMAMRMIRDEWMWSWGPSPGAIPKHLARLAEDLARFVLPPRREGRNFPRAVKVKMSNFPRKRTLATQPGLK